MLLLLFATAVVIGSSALIYFFILPKIVENRAIENKPVDQYVNYRVVSVNLEDDKAVEYKDLTLDVVSTGKMSDFEIKNDKDKEAATGKKLKVFLNDGSKRSKSKNSFYIAIELVPASGDRNLASGAVRNALIKKKGDEALKAFEDGTSESSESYVTEDDVVNVDIEVLFQEGATFKVSPYTHGAKMFFDNLRNTKYAEFNADLWSDNLIYFQIIDEYYSGEDAGFPLESDEFSLKNVKDLVFIL
ncbi:hypothetical protein ACFLZK_02075 [Patescibacteria group bacterium]